MTQRTVAGLLAVPLLLALLVVAAFRPLPYVSYEPGPTADVLGSFDGHDIIRVKGHRTYPTEGQLRMLTVRVSNPDAPINLLQAMHDWISPDDAVYPYDAVYRKGETAKQNTQEGAVQMTSSQDAAAAVALTELGYDVEQPGVAEVVKGAPADGKLKVRDVILRVNGRPVAKLEDVGTAVRATPAGRPVTFDVRRAGKPVRVSMEPTQKDGKPYVGISVGAIYDFPFDVTVAPDPTIGGPSAGLIFSLGIYDTLTPGALTGGHTIAGTGEINPDGTVAPIGGIQQKIVGARQAGGQLFLVPADNCGETAGAQNGDMRLVKVTTMHDAVQSIKAWVKDPDASLPSCEKGSS